MNIGFFAVTAAWQSWRTYFGGLLRSLRQVHRTSVRVSLLTSDSQYHEWSHLLDVVDEAIIIPSCDKWTLNWIRNALGKKSTGYDSVMDEFLSNRGINVTVFGDCRWKSVIPSVAWLPDFQHLWLPSMFSESERQGRSSSFLRIAANATRVLLHSESVKADFQSFAPQYADKVRVVSPVTWVPESVYESDPKLVSDHYGLPEKFVYLPNQFYKHKNHLAAFRALRVLKDRGTNVFLTCSGHPVDYRDLKYFPDLMQQVRELGIENQVVFLGLIPWAHVLMLMRQSICVLNPSAFEGYGMTVDEARSLGKCLLASDIAAHRGQGIPNALFFDPQNVEDLARQLGMIWCGKTPGPDLELEAKARTLQPDRIRQYVTTFMSVIEEVV